MSVFYTGAGDEGETGVLGKGRMLKSNKRFEALGTLDELNAILGMARATSQSELVREVVLQTQRQLYALMSEVASMPEAAERFKFATPETVSWIEGQIERISAVVEIPREFIVPGDTPGSAALDMARAVARRAERRLVELFDRNELANREILRYINRLSSLIYVLELAENGARPTLAKGN